MKKILLVIIFSFFNVLFLSAQDTATTTSKTVGKNFLRSDRNLSIEIPIWIPGFRGTFAYGDVSLEGEDGINPGEPSHPIEPPDPGEPPIGGGNIFSRLFTSTAYIKFFFMGKVRYTRNKFTSQISVHGGSVGSSVNFKFNNKEVVQATYRTAFTRLLAGYSFFERENSSQTRRLNIYGYGGVRVHYFDIFSDLNWISNKLDLNFFWGEPIVGIQSRVTLKNWLFILKGDVGNFYSGKNYSYMIQAFCHYRLSNLLSLKFGWTDYDINHRRIILDEQLILNVHLSGPNAGLAFHF